MPTHTATHCSAFDDPAAATTMTRFCMSQHKYQLI